MWRQVGCVVKSIIVAECEPHVPMLMRPTDRSTAILECVEIA